MTQGLTETQFHRLAAFNAAVARATDPSVMMTLGETAFQREFGHKLFTLLKVDRMPVSCAGSTRAIPRSTLSGGTKPIEAGNWTQRVLVEGLHYVGRKPLRSQERIRRP